MYIFLLKKKEEKRLYLFDLNFILEKLSVELSALEYLR